MMTRRGYKNLILATLAIFILAVVWPEFLVRAVDSLRLPFPVSSVTPTATTTKEQLNEIAQVTPPSELVDVRGISFDISKLTAEPNGSASTTATSTAAVTFRNHVRIPRMGVDADVFDGPTEKTLSKGLWHIPGSALPGTNGNIVISAHRWLYKPPNPKTFYLIEDMQVGDPIYYEYGQSRYEYKVTKTFTVNPDEVEILRQDENKLTLFTCTPLYSTTYRRVVNAELISVTPL